MTKLLRAPTDISNYIDDLTAGLGARGSSFRDVDRLTVVHNGGGRPRFLFQELKWRGELDNQTDGQTSSLDWLMKDLVRASISFTIWRVVIEPDRTLTVKDYRANIEKNLSPEEYRAAYRRWWFPSAVATERPRPSAQHPPCATKAQHLRNTQPQNTTPPTHNDM